MLCQKHVEMFSNIYYGTWLNMWRYILQYRGDVPISRSSQILTLKLVHTESHHQWQVRFSSSGTGSHSGFCSWVSVLIKCYSLCSPVGLSSPEGNGVPCAPYVHTSLVDLRRIIDFSICPAFYLIGQSCNFQAPHIHNWIVGIIQISIYIYISISLCVYIYNLHIYI